MSVLFFLSTRSSVTAFARLWPQWLSRHLSPQSDAFARFSRYKFVRDKPRPHVVVVLSSHTSPQTFVSLESPKFYHYANVIYSCAPWNSLTTLMLPPQPGNTDLEDPFADIFIPKNSSPAFSHIFTDWKDIKSATLIDAVENQLGRKISVETPGECPLVLDMDDVDAEKEGDEDCALSPVSRFDEVCLGGSFDWLHAGHRLLLTNALGRTISRLTVGVTDDVMTSTKALASVVLPCDQRISDVQNFLRLIQVGCPSLTVVAISDAFGPSITIPRLDCLVASQETEKGARAVNLKRVELGLPPAQQTVIIDLVQAADEYAQKMSSSTIRYELLGELVKTPRVSQRKGGPSKTFIIGLTGISASGKSSIAQRIRAILQQDTEETSFAVHIINCDSLGHLAYTKDSPAYKEMVAFFGADQILNNESGEVCRKKLGALVFSQPSHLNKLNQIVWPRIRDLVLDEISRFESQTRSQNRVVIVDAALLLEARWDDLVDEVWVCLLSPEEACRRIVQRDGLSDDVANKRLSNQMPNCKRLLHANVILTSQFEPAITQKLTEKACSRLRERLSKSSSKL